MTEPISEFERGMAHATRLIHEIVERSYIEAIEEEAEAVKGPKARAVFFQGRRNGIGYIKALIKDRQ